MAGATAQSPSRHQGTDGTFKTLVQEGTSEGHEGERLDPVEFEALKGRFYRSRVSPSQNPTTEMA